MRNEVIFIKKERQSPPIIIFCILGIIAGFRLLFFGDLWFCVGAIVLISISLAGISFADKWYYDTKNNALLRKRNILFFVTKNRENLPPVISIALVKMRQSQNLYAASISGYIAEELCAVNLIHEKGTSKRFTRLLSIEKKKAEEVARKISEKTGKPIFENNCMKENKITE